MKYLTIAIAKIVLRTSRLLGNSGSALPGLVAEKLRPGLSHELLKQIKFGTTVITGTNGKTTTTKIMTLMLEAQGYKVFTNKTGSNFTRGILSSLIEKCTLGGGLDYDIAILELDEAYSRIFAREVKPKLVVALNVMRDQLDRYGEIDKTAELIGEAITFADGAVLNADDPPVARLSKKVKQKQNVTFFGVSHLLKSKLPTDDELLARDKKTEAPKTKHQADVKLTKAGKGELEIEIDGQKHRSEIKLEGVHNALNATAAVAAIQHLFHGKIPTKNLVDSIGQVEPAFGRGEKITLQDRNVHIALVKNPSGFNQNLRAFVSEDVRVILVLINDNYADSRDVSWLWDVDFSGINRHDPTIITGGIRAHDMALRLQYEDIEVDSVYQDIGEALEQALSSGDTTEDVLVFPTYTAMLELRKILKKYSVVEDIW